MKTPKDNVSMSSMPPEGLTQENWPTTRYVTTLQNIDASEHDTVACTISNDMRYQNVLIPLITSIRESHPDMEQLYMEGQCYNFHLIIKSIFPEAQFYYDQVAGHGITKLDHSFYDIRGRLEDVSASFIPFEETGITDHPMEWGKRDNRRLRRTGAIIKNGAPVFEVKNKDKCVDIDALRFICDEMQMATCGIFNVDENLIHNTLTSYHFKGGSAILSLMIGSALQAMGNEISYVDMKTRQHRLVLVNWNNVFFDYIHPLGFENIVDCAYWEEGAEVAVVNKDTLIKIYANTFDELENNLLGVWGNVINEIAIKNNT